jgi:hypothetical protein
MNFLTPKQVPLPRTGASLEKLAGVGGAAITILAVVGTAPAAMALSFTEGSLVFDVNAGAQTAPALRYRNIRANDGGQQEVYLGQEDLGVGTNRVALNMNPRWNAPGTNTFEFVFNPTGPETAKANGQSLTNAGNANAVGLDTEQKVNYLQLFLNQGDAANRITLNNLFMTPTGGSTVSLGSGFGSLIPDLGGGNWYINDNALLAGFTLTGELVAAGSTGNGAERPRIDFKTGYVEPIPTPALLPGLIGMGIAALRRRKAAADPETAGN